LSLSSLPDPDDITFPSILVPLDIDSPHVPPIPTGSQRDDAVDEDVFGLMTFIETPPHLSLGSVSTDAASAKSPEELLLDAEEMSVPVNFPSSETVSAGQAEIENGEKEEHPLVEVARRAILGEEGVTHLDIMVPIDLPSSDYTHSDETFEEDITIRPFRMQAIRAPARNHELHLTQDDSITHEDLQFTLDTTDPSTSGRLTEAISRLSKSTATTLAVSQGGVRVKNRVSTPYRISGTAMVAFDGVDNEDTLTPTRMSSSTARMILHRGDTTKHGPVNPCLERSQAKRLDGGADVDDTTVRAYQPAEIRDADDRYDTPPVSSLSSSTNLPHKPICLDVPITSSGVLLSGVERALNFLASSSEPDSTDHGRCNRLNVDNIADAEFADAVGIDFAYEPCDPELDFDAASPPHTLRSGFATPPSSVLIIPPLVRGELSERPSSLHYVRLTV